MSALPLGGFIYAAVKPILRIYLLMATGFFLARYDLMSVETARAVSDMILLVFMPSLSFTKVVSNLDISDIKTIGVMVLCAVLMYATSAAFAFINVFVLTPVPKRWRGGAILAGILQNVSDLPIAYLQSIAGGLIFTTDEGEKGVAYVIIFLAVYVSVQFNCGLFQLVEYDFKKQEQDFAREATALKNKESAESPEDSPKQESHAGDVDDNGVPVSPTSTLSSDEDDDIQASELNPRVLHSNELASARKVLSNASTVSRIPSARGRRGSIPSSNNMSPASRHSPGISSVRNRRTSFASTFISAVVTGQSVQTNDLNHDDDLVREYSRAEPYNQNMTRITSMITQSNLSKKDIENAGKSISFVQKYHLQPLVFVMMNFLTPNSMALIVSLTVALVPWLKALFVNTGSRTISQAPDQNPALSFFLDYTTYLSAPCVPLGLIMLGATIARLKIKSIPRGFWKSVLAHTLFRLCVLPIVGLAFVGEMSRLNWLSDEMAKFVVILQFGLPSATVQVYLTASNMRPDSPSHLQMDCLALYIIAQYTMLVVSMPILVTYTLKNILDK